MSLGSLYSRGDSDRSPLQLPQHCRRPLMRLQAPPVRTCKGSGERMRLKDMLCDSKSCADAVSHDCASNHHLLAHARIRTHSQ